MIKMYCIHMKFSYNESKLLLKYLIKTLLIQQKKSYYPPMSFWISLTLMRFHLSPYHFNVCVLIHFCSVCFTPFQIKCAESWSHVWHVLRTFHWPYRLFFILISSKHLFTMFLISILMHATLYICYTCWKYFLFINLFHNYFISILSHPHSICFFFFLNIWLLSFKPIYLWNWVGYS